MIINIIGLLIGIVILAAGLYYLLKEKSDPDSRKIYGIAVAVGIIITIFMAAKLLS